MRWAAADFACPEILQQQLFFARIDQIGLAKKKAYSGAHDTWTRQGR